MTIATQREFSVLVAGAGPVGMIAALSLAREGFDVALVGPAAAGGDSRTTALMLPALRALEAIGLAPFGDDVSAPLRAMRIIDGTTRLLRSAPVTFRASEIGESEFGRNIPNAILNRVLEAAVRAQPGIRWIERLVASWEIDAGQAVAVFDDGTRLSARLVAAADGRNSAAREAAGIASSTSRLPQSALVVNFSHSRPHGFTSTEFHTEEGPFTQVPLPGARSSLVWVMTPERAAEMMTLGEAGLSHAVEERMQSMLGRVTVETVPQLWPLSSARASTLAGHRVALVGEAAHVFPPIGAQGMNLGIRDVVDLTRAAVENREDPGADRALSAYRAARRADVLARSSAVNLLNRSLLSDLLPAQLVRSVGLQLMSNVTPLRAFLMREGLRPGSGIAGLFSGLREKVRRQEA